MKAFAIAPANIHFVCALFKNYTYIGRAACCECFLLQLMQVVHSLLVAETAFHY